MCRSGFVGVARQQRAPRCGVAWPGVVLLAVLLFNESCVLLLVELLACIRVECFVSLTLIYRVLCCCLCCLC